MTGMGMMKAYPSFAAYLAAQKPAQRRIIQALRRFVKRTAPRLTETVKWGNGCWVVSDAPAAERARKPGDACWAKGARPVCYVYADKGFVQFGFFRGEPAQGSEEASARERAVRPAHQSLQAVRHPPAHVRPAAAPGREVSK